MRFELENTNNNCVLGRIKDGNNEYIVIQYTPYKTACIPLVNQTANKTKTKRRNENVKLSSSKKHDGQRYCQ